jgi:hypothetical protein
MAKSTDALVDPVDTKDLEGEDTDKVAADESATNTQALESAKTEGEARTSAAPIEKLKHLAEEIKAVEARRGEIVKIDDFLSNDPPEMDKSLLLLEKLRYEMGSDKLGAEGLEADLKHLATLHERKNALATELDEADKALKIELTKETAEQIATDFEVLIGMRYDSAYPTQEQLTYHTKEHPRALEPRLNKVIDVFLKNSPELFYDLVGSTDPEVVDVKVKAMLKVLAWSHDSVQKAKVDEGETNKRTRFRGFKEENLTDVAKIDPAARGNERESAEEMKAVISKYHEEVGMEVFSEKEIAEMEKAIGATYVYFDFQRMTLVQQYLEKDAGPLVWALAMADIRGDAGMGKFEELARGGDAEFAELNPSMPEWIAQGRSGDMSKRAEVGKQMLDWWKTQPNFCRSQKEILESSLKDISISIENQLEGDPDAKKHKAKTVKDSLGELFSNFDKNEQAAQERYLRMEASYGYPNPQELTNLTQKKNELKKRLDSENQGGRSESVNSIKAEYDRAVEAEAAALKIRDERLASLTAEEFEQLVAENRINFTAEKQ